MHIYAWMALCAALAVVVFWMWLRSQADSDAIYFARQDRDAAKKYQGLLLNHGWFQEQPERVRWIKVFYIWSPNYSEDYSFSAKVRALEKILAVSHPNVRVVETIEKSHRMGEVTFATFKNPTPVNCRDYY